VAWQPGERIVRREVWRGRPWFACVAIVVADEPDLLVTFVPTGSPFGFPPSTDGRPHPWLGRAAWEGHGVLHLQRPGEAYAVWHFWDGPDRAFAGWYLNLQEPFRRTAIGFDTMDLELDVWLPAEGGWELKDDDLLEERVAEGRFDEEEVVAIRGLGNAITSRLDRGDTWWDPAWAAFQPDPAWADPTFPHGWDDAPARPGPGPDALVARLD
jgi:hypothetical protein